MSGGPDAEALSSAEIARVLRAVYDSPAVEVATARDGRPQTFPMSPFYDREEGTVVVTSPPAFAGKVEAVRENPRVSMLFYDAEEPFLLRGRATVHDGDLEGNAEYVRRLVAEEPASERRAGFTRTASLLESRGGRFLFGWYALRVVVAVRPVAVEPVEGTAGELPPWPAAGVDADEADSYARLAFTVVEEGWPTTRPVADVEVRGEEARLDVPVSVEAGQPACLLCHWHTPGLEKLGQRLLRGRCRPADGRVAFRPKSSYEIRNATLLDRLKFAVGGKLRTRAYVD